MSRETVNEASTMTVRVAFFGTTGSQSAPATARYRIKDVTNDRIVRDWTDLIPAEEVDIEIPAGDNSVYMDGSRPFRRFEERVVTIQANYESDIQYMDEIRYLVKNLRGFDS